MTGTANFAAGVADKVLFQAKVILDPIAEPGGQRKDSAVLAASFVRRCFARERSEESGIGTGA